jgi:exodeoxyribonuclease VII small subunit
MVKNKLPLTYDAAYTELRGILTALQEETVNIDDLADKVERAHILVQFCREKLRQTAEKVNQLNQQINPS